MKIATAPPDLPEPVTEQIPQVPLFKMPNPQVWTIQIADWVTNACEAYQTLKQFPDESSWATEEEIFEEFALTERHACNFIVYGLTADQWFYLEYIFSNFAFKFEEFRKVLESMNTHATNRHETMQRWQEKMKDFMGDLEQDIQPEEPGFFKKLFK